MTVLETLKNLGWWLLDRPKEVLVMVSIFSFIGIAGPTLATGAMQYQYNQDTWAKTHTANCGILAYCVDHNSTITSVRDFSVECDTWFSSGTCPRENLGFSVGFNQTINCHYYTVGDRVLVTEKFDYYPASNSTKIAWALKGGPC